jgi:hypothetical protein
MINWKSLAVSAAVTTAIVGIASAQGAGGGTGGAGTGAAGVSGTNGTGSKNATGSSDRGQHPNGTSTQRAPMTNDGSGTGGGGRQ